MGVGLVIHSHMQEVNLQTDPETLGRDELYERIMYRVRRMYNFEISERQAHEATRNLIGFCEAAIGQKEA